MSPISVDDFCDEESKLIFTIRKDYYENRNGSALMKIVCVLHNSFCRRVNESNARYMKSLGDNNHHFVIFGSGFYGKKLYESMQKYGLESKVIYFCDNNKNKLGSVLLGLPIIAVTDVVDDDSVVFLIPNSQNSKEMIHQLEQLGVDNGRYILISENISKHNNMQFIDDLQSIMFNPDNIFILYGTDHFASLFLQLMIKSNIHPAFAISDFVGEDEDLSAFCTKEYVNKTFFICFSGLHKERLLKNGISSDHIIHIAPQLAEEQYFDDVVPIHKLGKKEVFIDAGCCDFLTSKYFLKWCKNECKKIYAFECDPRGIELCNTVLENDPELNIAELITKGLWDEDTVLEFDVSDSLSSANVSLREGYRKIQINTTTIDDVLNGDEVTFIKMDIEGSELKALKGAEESIKRWHPILALSVYHKPEDIVEIPEYIRSIVPEYKLYLRTYQENHNETVLYAVY